MCEFCKEPYGRMITDGLFEQCRIECLKDVSSNRSRYTLCVNNGAHAEINFCPKCGRKLSEVSENEHGESIRTDE